MSVHFDGLPSHKQQLFQHRLLKIIICLPAGNLLCIVMEYAPNGDLGRFIKKGNELKKAFPEEIIWKYFMQICEGLQALHAAKIIHRDIKPMNIFVGDHDVVKVRMMFHACTAARVGKFICNQSCIV